MNYVDGIKVTGGATVSAVLTVGRINELVAVVVGIVTVAYLVGCIVKKQLEITHERMEVDRLREVMRQEAERVVREQAEAITRRLIDSSDPESPK